MADRWWTSATHCPLAAATSRMDAEATSVLVAQRHAAIEGSREPPKIPPTTISWGTNEYGTQAISFHFEGDPTPITVEPALDMEQVTNDYMLDLYEWSRDPHDEILDPEGNELPDCDRSDGDADSICICIPIPSSIEGVPDLPNNGEPHVTMLYVGSGTMEDAHRICDLVAAESESLAGEQMALGALGHFDRGEVVVAHARVLISPAVAHARERLLEVVEGAGFEPKHHPGPWRPHATLEYLEPGRSFDGAVPTGSWTCTGAEVWRGSERFVNGSRGDKLARSGDKWLVLSSDGKQLGEVDTEAEARERLRQIEAGKAGKAARADGLARMLEEAGANKDWWVHNTLAHPLMELLTEQGFISEADALHGLTLPEDHAELADPAAFAAWLASAITRADADLDEGKIKDWLVEHISGARKMSRPRMLRLAEAAGSFAYLKPPKVATVYRGLHNVPASKAGKLTGQSDPVRDKSWTTDINVAAKFASTEWCSDEPLDGCVGVVLVADAVPDQLLLDHEAIAELPGVFDQWDDRWGETLESAIRDEREVLAMGPLNVRTVKLVDMVSLEDGGQSRLVQDGQNAKKPHPRSRARREAASNLRRARRYAPAVHTESRNVFEALRADRAELGGQVQQANGWRRYPIIYSKSGNIQKYPGPGGTMISEYRPEPVVRGPRSRNSGVGCPWELRHSADLITPDSVRGVALGAVLTVEADSDGIHTSGFAQAWGRDLFEAIDAPRGDPRAARDVSVAYRVKVDPRPGTTDDGQRFDQVLVDLIWNSLASEPNGKAGTARVLTPRADATDGIWVSRADTLLDIARRGTPPSKPVYYDLSSWVRHDAAHQPARTTQDAHDMNLLTRLFKALGMTEADIAKALDITEPEAAALLSGETELTDEQVTLAVEAIVPRGGDAKPPPEGEPPPREDGSGDLVAGLRALLAKAEERADKAVRRADKAEVLATARKDALETMVPRADADKMVSERGALIGEAMSLTHRALGAGFEPEPRQDADGKPLPRTLEDWQRAAVTGAFGDKAPAILERIDAKSDPSIRKDNLADRVQDAKEILNEAGHKSVEVRASIRRLRDDEAARRQDSNTNPSVGLAAHKQAQRKLAAGETQAPNGT